MDKVLDKLGIYDLFAVLISGISICIISLFVFQDIYKIDISIRLPVNQTISFLVISYFVGLIFQEVGSLIYKKIICRNNLLLKKALRDSALSYTFFTKTEKDSVYAYIQSKLKVKKVSDSMAFNYCKFYVIKNFDTTKIDRDQSLSAMSRSLSLYFGVSAIVAIVTVFDDFSCQKFIFFLVSTALSILLYYRCIRFAELRYIHIFRTFYYNVVVKKISKISN